MRFPKITVGKHTFVPAAFDPISTADPRFKVYGTGVIIERPDDIRGDSVNMIAVGGRCDAVSEFVTARRDEEAAKAAAEQDADIEIGAAQQSPA